MTNWIGVCMVRVSSEIIFYIPKYKNFISLPLLYDWYFYSEINALQQNPLLFNKFLVLINNVYLKSKSK